MGKQYITGFIVSLLLTILAEFPVFAGMISDVSVSYKENGALVVDAGTIGKNSDGLVMNYDIILIDEAYDMHSMNTGFISSGEELVREINMNDMPEGKYTAYVTIKYTDGATNNGAENRMEDASSEEFSYPDIQKRLKTGSVQKNIIKWMILIAAGICLLLPIYLFIRRKAQDLTNR